MFNKLNKKYHNGDLLHYEIKDFGRLITAACVELRRMAQLDWSIPGPKRSCDIHLRLLTVQGSPRQDPGETFNMNILLLNSMML